MHSLSLTVHITAVMKFNQGHPQRSLYERWGESHELFSSRVPRYVSGIKLWYTAGREDRKGWVWKHGNACLWTCQVAQDLENKTWCLWMLIRPLLSNPMCPTSLGLQLLSRQQSDTHCSITLSTEALPTKGWELKGLSSLPASREQKHLVWALNLWGATKVCINFTWIT